MTIDQSCNKKKNRKELEEWEQKMIACWKTEWYADLQLDSCYYTHQEEDCFAEWLVSNMEFLKAGQIKNRRMNFLMKGLSILSFIAVYIFLIKWNMDNVSKSTLTPVISLIPSYAITQWLNMKKYQETWSRYSRFYSLILQEMVKYIYKVQPYRHSMDETTCFIENIIALTKENGNQFNQNMMNKENKLFSFSKLADKIK